jgi:ABC-2 type transport system ATP-binding protein
MTENVVSVRGLRKTYGDVLAVDGIDFEVEKGEIFGLLGPNGAGKTSTLECLEGLRAADGGQMDVLGIDPTRQAGQMKNLIGVQLQTSALPSTMTCREAMEFFCAYHQVPPRLDMLKRLGLGDKLDSQYQQLSTGLQRRLALALAVAHQPPLVILDEPTAGLDVGSRAELHAIMEELHEAGTTVLLATHDMAEAEKMAHRVAILLRGRIVATGSPRELTAQGGGLTKVSVRTEQSLLRQLDSAPSFPAVTRSWADEEYAMYFTSDPAPTVAAILEHVKSTDDRLIDLRVERPSLEERFLEITEGGGTA